jgi:hypothetical protein
MRGAPLVGTFPSAICVGEARVFLLVVLAVVYVVMERLVHMFGCVVWKGDQGGCVTARRGAGLV